MSKFDELWALSEEMALSKKVKELVAALSEIDAHKPECPDDDPGFADRERAFEALAAVVLFLSDLGAGSHALKALGWELVNLIEYGRHGPLLAAPKQGKRNRTPLHIARSRGYVAAIVDLRRRQAQRNRTEAVQWVFNHIPEGIARKLADSPPLTIGAIENWHDKATGKCPDSRKDTATEIEMREGYDAIMCRFPTKSDPPSEAGLLRMLREGLC